MNLDAMSPSDLQKVSDKDLRPYARAKVKAMAARARGDIATALLLEDSCDRIYRRLPKAKQW